MTRYLVLRLRRGSLRNSTSTWEIAIILREFLRQSVRGDIVAGPNLRAIYRKIRILVGTTGDIGLRLGRWKIVFVLATAIFCRFLPIFILNVSTEIKQSIHFILFLIFFTFSINYRPCVTSSWIESSSVLCPIPFIRT